MLVAQIDFGFFLLVGISAAILLSKETKYLDKYSQITEQPKITWNTNTAKAILVRQKLQIWIKQALKKEKLELLWKFCN